MRVAGVPFSYDHAVPRRRRGERWPCSSASCKAGRRSAACWRAKWRAYEKWANDELRALYSPLRARDFAIRHAAAIARPGCSPAASSRLVGLRHHPRRVLRLHAGVVDGARASQAAQGARGSARLARCSRWPTPSSSRRTSRTRSRPSRSTSIRRSARRPTSWSSRCASARRWTRRCAISPQRCQSRNVDAIVTALTVGRQTGGELPKVLEKTAGVLRETHARRRRHGLQDVRGQGADRRHGHAAVRLRRRAAGRSIPSGCSPLFHDPIGWALLALACVLEAIGLRHGAQADARSRCDVLIDLTPRSTSAAAVVFVGCGGDAVRRRRCSAVRRSARSGAASAIAPRAAARRWSARRCCALVWPLVRVFTNYARFMPKRLKEQTSAQLAQRRRAVRPSPPTSSLGFNLVCALGGFLLMALSRRSRSTWASASRSSASSSASCCPASGWRRGADAPARRSTAACRRRSISLCMSMGAGLDFIGSVRHVVEQVVATRATRSTKSCARFLHELASARRAREALEDLRRSARRRSWCKAIRDQRDPGGAARHAAHRGAHDSGRGRAHQALPDRRESGRAAPACVILMPLMFIFARDGDRHVRQPHRQRLPGAALLRCRRSADRGRLSGDAVHRCSCRASATSPRLSCSISRRVLVGRGLRVPTCASSTTASRAGSCSSSAGVGSTGEPRFRITPQKRPTRRYVNGQPPSKAPIKPGDVVAVADVRITLERKVDKREEHVEAGARARRACRC